MTIDERGFPQAPSVGLLAWRHGPKRLVQAGHEDAAEGWPGPPPSVLGLGHLRDIFRQGMTQAYLGWALQSGGKDFVVWAGTSPHVVLVRPESVEFALGKGEELLRNSIPSEELFGQGLLRMEGKPWQQRRVLHAKAFRPGALQQVTAIIIDEAEQLIARWREHVGVFGPARELSSCMLRILGRFLFGFEFDLASHGGKSLHHALITLSTDALQRHLLPGPLVKLWNGRRVARARMWLDGLCRELLQHGGDTPFLRELRSALASGEMSEVAVLDEIRTFLIAGHETSATALSWIIALLAEHSEAAERVRGEASTRGLEHLDYTTCVIKESMRLYPPAPLSVSVAMQDVTLGDLFVPRGTRVDISSYVLHRLPWLWPEPKVFRPERFVEFDDRHTGAYFPFLLGPHRCIGAGLAMLELRIVSAMLAQAFEFELPEGPPRANLRVSLHPSGFRMRVVARRSAPASRQLQRVS